MPFGNWTDRKINEDLGRPEVSTKRGENEHVVVERFYSITDIKSMQGA